MPNFVEGTGFKVDVPACYGGGYGCVNTTGCRLCSTQPPHLYMECPKCVFDYYGLLPPPPCLLRQRERRAQT